MDDSETTIIAVAVVEHDRQYLIGKRPPGVPLAGYCEFPGGKVHPGETPAAAAERECLEETGLQVEVVRQLDAAVHDYDHGQLQLYFFLCGLLTYNLLNAPIGLPNRPVVGPCAIAVQDMKASTTLACTA